MTRPDSGLIADGHAVFAAGDMPTVVDFLDPAITWHVPDGGPVSGTYRGHDQVLRFLAGCLQRSGGTLRVAVVGITCDGDHVSVRCTVTAEPAPEPDEHDFPGREG